MIQSTKDAYESRKKWLELRAKPRETRQKPKVKRQSIPIEKMYRYIDLSKPRNPRNKFDCDTENILAMSKSAKHCEANDRLKELALPRKLKNVGGHFIPYSHYLHFASRP